MEYNISLSDLQLKKIAAAIKKKTDVIIQLKYNQLSGNNKILLTEQQKNKIERAKKNKAGVRLKLKYKNMIQGGFLDPATWGIILTGIGALGALVGGASAVAKTVIDKKAKDKELEEQIRHNKAMEGKGLKKTKTKK